MSYRTEVFTMLPWVGGYNTSQDPSLIGKNQLTSGENIIFSSDTSRKQRPAINYDWDDQTSSTSSILGGKDFWYGSTGTRTQVVVAVADDASVGSYNPSTGAKTALSISSTSTQWSSVVSQVCFEVFNNKLIWSGDGSGNLPMIWTGTGSYTNLTNAPQASIIRSHLGRLWSNDKTNKDRLHYSETFAETVWNGVGDSGALDIGVGDGDPNGIVAIFPSFKGVLFVAKRTKLYKISGFTPETFVVELVSSGIGCVSHNSVALIDQDDIYFLSERGVHSIAATDAYGDFEGAYLSKDIQRTFNESWIKTRLENTQAAYIPTINSYIIAVTDDSYSSTVNKAIWCYHVPSKSWYLWPNISCEALFPVTLSGLKVFFLGSDTKRLARGLIDSDNDTSEAGVSTPILFHIASGFIFPSDNPYIVNGFKCVGIYFTPTGAYDLTIRFQIDTYEEQLLTISGEGGESLDVDFILDESILQAPAVMQPAIFSVDGYGRSFKISIEQNSTNKSIEIQGFAVEFEKMGPQQETTLTQG